MSDEYSYCIGLLDDMCTFDCQGGKNMEKNNGKEKRARELFTKEVQKEKANKGWKYNRNLLETSIDFLVTIGPDGIITDVNSATEKATGLPREKIIGTDFSEYFTEPDKARVGYKQVFDIGKVVDYELYLKHINGSSIPVLYNASVYKDNEGQIIGALVVARDISAIKKHEDELIDFENNLELIVQQKTAELIIANKELVFQNEEKADRAAELVIANKELIFQTGEKADRAAELVIANKELVFQDEEKADRAAELVIANKELVFQDEEKADRAAELVIANKELAFQNEEKEKRATELIIANKEIAFQDEEISYTSRHDFLTGLYNRAYFEEEKKRLDTARQLPFSIIVGDINGLKLINYGFGHSKGDEVLIEVAKNLKSCCSKEAIISKIGGDEFGILLPRTDSQSAQLICNHIYDTCKGHALIGSAIYPSISLGYATKMTKTETMDDIFMAAEKSMSKQKLLESKSAHSSIIVSIKAIMHEKSQETEEHADRLIQLSKRVGLAMSLKDDQLNELELLCTLHDIGKVSISYDILSKHGKLSNEEWREIKKHPEVGFRIAQATSDLEPIAEYILCHHERWDGKGYPQGLIGEEIPLLSRIVAIVDSFDAMTSDRAYRSAMTKGEAMEKIRRNAGTQFDPDIAQLFLNIMS